MSGPLDKAWRNYREVVMPEVGEKQRVSCRLAFYAGSAELFNAITHSTSEPGLDALMTSVSCELNEFSRSVKNRDV